MSRFDDPPLIFCNTCNHREPQNITCPHDPLHGSCGGPEFCAVCVRPKVDEPPLPPPEPAVEPDTEVIEPTLVQISDDDMFGIVKAKRPAIVTPVVEDGPLFEKISESANGIQIDGFARAGYANITIRAAGKTTKEMAAMVAAMQRAIAAGQS